MAQAPRNSRRGPASPSSTFAMPHDSVTSYSYYHYVARREVRHGACQSAAPTRPHSHPERPETAA